MNNKMLKDDNKYEMTIKDDTKLINDLNRKKKDQIENRKHKTTIKEKLQERNKRQ